MPTGDLPPLHPNQVEILEFSLEQVKALSSAIRAEVFWSFHQYNHKSVNDIAKEIGKSAQTVHYHTNALLDLGLIVATETRQKRSRTEQLYLRKARTAIDPATGVTELYNRYRVRGFKLETQRMCDETSHFFGMLERDPTLVKFAAFRKYRFTLTRDRADKLRWDLVNLLLEAFKEQTPVEEGGVQVNTVVYMRPTVAQLKAWAEKEGIPFSELARDRIPPEDETD